MLYAVSPPSEKINSAERIGGDLILRSDFGLMRISPKSEKIIRITVTKEGGFSPFCGPGIVFDGGFSDWEYSETKAEISLKTASLCIEISRDTASICVKDSSGGVLFKDSGRDSVSLEKFKVYELGEAVTEKIQTADGEKEIIAEAKKTEAGYSYHARLGLRFADGEELYGLGQNEEGFGSLRGRTVYLNQANRKIAIPFIVSSLGCGLLFNAYSPCIFSDSPEESYFRVEAAKELDFYFILGPDMRGAIAGYRFLTGKAVLLPRWAFGYIQSQEKYDDQNEILSVAKEYRRRGLALDCIVQDWCSWEDGKWGQKSFDKARYPEPKKMTDELHKNHVKFMLSVWANASENTENYAEFKAAGLLLPGCAVYNALSEKGRKIYWNQLERELFSCGVDAWWCDNSEPFTPEWNHQEKPAPAIMYSEYLKETEGRLPPEYSNAFGLYHAMGVYEGQRANAEEKRVFNLTRSASLGQQRFGAAMWSGDVAATWETLKNQVAAGLNFCASGLPYWTTDVGGFFVKRGSPWYWRGDFDGCFNDPSYCELFVRWLQWETFLPIFRGHGTDCRRELWNLKNGGEKFCEAAVFTQKLRYELMPYIYSSAGDCYINDDSMILPLAFDFSYDETALKIKDQYMFGREIMVCPVVSPMYYLPNGVETESPKTREVYLPSGCDWYDFYTEKRYSGGRFITADAPIDKIPLFVKEGSIIPTAKFALSTEEQSPELNLNIYSRGEAAYTLYEDSFDGYGFERGEYILTDIFFDGEELKLCRRTSWDIPEEEKKRRYTFAGKKVIR